MSKYITVYSNDPTGSRISLLIKGKIEPYVTLKPRAVNFWGTTDRKLVRTVEIIPTQEVRLRINNIRSTISDEFKYTLNAGEKQGEYLLTVENIRTTPGRYYGKIIMETNLKKKPKLILNVYGNIKKPKDVHPDRKNKSG